MVLLGLLRNESCTAAGVLKSLGLDDLYGAWNEVGSMEVDVHARLEPAYQPNPASPCSMDISCGLSAHICFLDSYGNKRTNRLDTMPD